MKKGDSLEELGVGGTMWNRILWLEMVKWRNVVKSVTNLRDPYNAKNFLIG